MSSFSETLRVRVPSTCFLSTSEIGHGSRRGGRDEVGDKFVADATSSPYINIYIYIYRLSMVQEVLFTH